jgi:ribosomal protein S18 acetylase RimI-like enzyme
MIRAYKESDFPDIERIYNASKKDEFAGEKFDITVVPLSEDQQMLQLLRESNIYIYEKSDIVGFAGAKENYISWLFVHPDFRGKNIGKKLVSHVLSKLNGEVTLTVARSNIAATNLYQNLGFDIAKEFTGRYQGNPIVVRKMRKFVKNG